MELTRKLLPILLALILASSSQGRPPRDGDGDGYVITEQDYQGLQAFKHAVSDPRGFLRSWNDTGIGACSGAWAGIKCVRGKVIAISLPWRDLRGHITEKIGQLTALRKINLHDNSLGGQIPQAIGFLPDLRGVYLFNNRLSGSIPPSIGNCLMLQALDVSNNSITGSFPATISNSSKLYRLNLSYNSLSGPIPIEVTRIPSLTLLFLQHNNLSGSIPDTWGRTRLRNLNLDGNSFSGKIPVSLTRQPLLEELILSNNLLNGSIPREIGSLSRLRSLDLSENDLTGEIPNSLDQLTNLSSFNVSYNTLSGPVPLLLSKKFNSSSFRGNAKLCGYTATIPCVSPNLPSQSVPAEAKHRRLSTKTIVLIAAGTAIGLLIPVCLILLCCLLQKKAALSEKSSEEKQQPAGPESKSEAKAGAGDGGGKLVHFEGPSTFAADDLLCATAEVLGKSTYGTVYKATLESGSQVAVKRLREKYARSPKEFEAEVSSIRKARHCNLLELRAYYLGPKGEKLLVFDFMPNGSLAAFLHARGPETFIDWPTRLSIAMGTACGLSHLHNHLNMVHGNLTSNNILLDDNLSPKIADFGLFRLMTPAANSNAIAAAAALGYRAPELHNMKKASTKTDVYSFGVIMLELLTGKLPSGAMNNGTELPQWVASVVKEEWTNEVFDPELMRDAEAGDEMVEALKIALQCVDPSPAVRPEAQEVLRHLEEMRPELASGAVAGTSATPAPEEGGASTSMQAGD